MASAGEHPELIVKLPNGEQPVAVSHKHSVALIQPEYDPLQKAWREGTQVDRAWMQGGSHTPRIQRVGFGLVSLILLVTGMWMLPMQFSVWDLERDGWGTEVIPGGIALALALFGGRGLWKALRVTPVKQDPKQKART